jgi:hypothetical protein
VSGANDQATVSGANDQATVSGANDQATVSGANDQATVSATDEQVTVSAADDKQAHEANIQVIKGVPTEPELAAVIAVLAAAAGVPAEPREQEENLWGHPVDRLRYTVFSWQRVTLLGRTHMRHR